MRYLEYSQRNNLITSGGSDYHGEKIKYAVELGRIYKGFENKKIDINNINVINERRKYKMAEESQKFGKLDEMSIEGYISVLNSELDENVLPYIYENELMFLEEKNEIYEEFLRIKAELSFFSSPSYSNDITAEVVRNKLERLYDDIQKLIVEVNSERKKK